MFERFIDTESPLTIPLTDDRYQIDINGTVSVCEGPVLKAVIKDNKQYYLLDWFDGLKDYPIELIMAFTFKPHFVESSLWNKLSVLFADGNEFNIHPENLVWKFPVGLEIKDLPGFAYIPSYSRYGIDRHGLVIKIDDKSHPKIYKSDLGYVRYSLVPDIGPRNNVPRHRLMCLAWYEYPSIVDKIYVNHRNETPGDDRLDNLEWITPRGNAVYSLAKSNIRRDEILSQEQSFILDVIVRNAKTNVITIYPTVSVCAENLNISVSTLYYYLREEPFSKVWPGYIQTGWLSEFESWIDHSDLDERNLAAEFGTAVLEKNVITGEVKEYVSARDCAFSHGYSELTIAVRLRNNNQKVFYDGYMYQYKKDEKPWRKVDNPLKEIEEALISRPIRVKNIYTNEEKQFESLTDCVNRIGLSFPVIVKARTSAFPHAPRYGWQFRWDNKPFKPLTEKQLMYFKLLDDENIPFRGRGYVLKCRTTGKESIFTNVGQVVKFLGLTRSHVSYLARNSGVVQNMSISYYLDDEDVKFD